MENLSEKIETLKIDFNSFKKIDFNSFKPG